MWIESLPIHENLSLAKKKTAQGVIPIRAYEFERNMALSYISQRIIII